MIRVGITKEFSLEVAPVMMEQLDQIFTKGVHSSFTDIGVYFSIEPKPFLSRILKEPYWETPESLKYYRWVLVVGQHQTVSREFNLYQFFQMTTEGKLAIFPYILDLNSPLRSFDSVPHIIFDKYGNLESICSGQTNTLERVTERVQQMGLLGETITWHPSDFSANDDILF